MIFTRITTIVAWIVLVGSAMRILTGVGIAAEILGPYEETLRRYGGGATTSGEIIDHAVHGLFIALALGTMTEISKHFRG
ncbi:hypothetical protein [Rhizobium sp. BG4]|uniref:hypothetical protein n=1 Tax=Rhizobium sp. BG4 TaxID=2613770 RepID=UPI00193E93B8|nr:hypothetical protein [Rhizobium sp. BG4]QRM44935.1 hypothetical protein F2982_16725 [Rhizobium sp. BG4]